MPDSKGQVSLEYLLIFSVSLIVLIAFTLPFLQDSMDNTFDVSDSLKAKSDLSKVAQAIGKVYGEGQGSKHTVTLDVDKPIKVNVKNQYISTNLKLKNKENKEIKVYVKSSLEGQTFRLDKGMNSLVVEWPAGEKNMIIY